MAGIGFSANPTTPHFSDGILCIFWVGFFYSACIAMTLQLMDPAGTASILSLVVLGSIFAQIWSSLQLFFAKRWFQSPVHIPHCRAFQACYVFVVWTRHRSICAGILASALTYGTCPRLLLWLPIQKRPATLPQSSSKRSRQQQVDGEISSSQTFDTISGNAENRHKAEYAHGCNVLAMHVSRAANKHISSHFVKGCGLSFEVSLDYVGESVDSHQRRHFNFVWKASIGYKIVKTSCFNLRRNQVDKLVNDVNAKNAKEIDDKKAKLTLINFPPEWITFARACELQYFARTSAEEVAKDYVGICIECRYLGVLANNVSEQSDYASEDNYAEHPLEWPDVGDDKKNSHRQVWCKWSLQLPDDKRCSKTLNDDSSMRNSVIFPTHLKQALQRCKFTKPPALEPLAVALHQLSSNCIRLPVVASTSHYLATPRVSLQNLDATVGNLETRNKVALQASRRRASACTRK